jgi:DNA adenine methylase
LQAAQPVRAHPFLKWAGGKGQALASLRDYFPPLTRDATYFEPFLGGGAVFFALKPARAVLSDLNDSLIAAYAAVKSSPAEMAKAIRELGPGTDEIEYYRVRKRYNRTITRTAARRDSEALEIAAMFVWLNHTCYNGLHRVNRAGEFNVPFGFYRKPFIFSEQALRLASSTLRAAHAKMFSGDYEVALASAQRGDLAYLDPPYDPGPAQTGFTGYTKSGFGEVDQERLSRVVRELVGRGCRIVLSNSPSPRVLELYKDYRTARIRVPRAINSDGAGRSKVSELVVVA